jgi:hypothetical protein
MKNINATTASATSATTIKTAKTKNALDYKELLSLNRGYRAGSLFRVLDYLNSKDIKEYYNNAYEALTIADLKELCPEYTAPKYDKKGVIVERKFEPFTFMVALRHRYGTI